MPFKCDKCDKLFQHKSSYDRHVARRNPCNKNDIIIKGDPDKVQRIDNDALYQLRDLIFEDSMKRHEKEFYEKFDNKFNEFIEKLTLFDKRLDKIEKQITILIKIKGEN